MNFILLLTGSALFLLVEGKRFEYIVDEYALVNEIEPSEFHPNDTEGISRPQFVPRGFASKIAFGAALPCGSQRVLNPGSSFDVDSPNFPKRSPRNTLCEWRFTLAAGAQVYLLCDFYNVPCAYKNSLQLTIQGHRSVTYCHQNPNQIYRNQRLALFTNTDSRPRLLTLSYIIEKFNSLSGRGIRCRVVAQGTANPTTAPPAATSKPLVNHAGCGIKNTKRIVDGGEANPNEWPWAVHIVIEKLNSNFACGGSVISDRAVLSAAHCFDNGVRKATAFFGCHDITAADCTQKITVPLANIIQHPKYGKVKLGKDLAVLLLPTTLTFSNTVRPVCLPQTENTVFAEDSLWVAGWGRTNTFAFPSKVLKEATLDHVPLSVCRQAFGNIGTDILCTKAGSGTTCFGDSGSGVTNLRNGRYFVDGVVSFGEKLCEDDPSANAEVFENLDFITQYI